MPKITPSKPPSYRLHKASGQAVVTFHHKDHYLGPYGSAESKRKYAQLIAELMSAPTASDESHDGEPITVAEVLAAFWQHAQEHYQKDGRPTSELGVMRDAMRPVKRLYADLPAVEFGPRRLKVVREAMIEHGYCRNVINRHVQRIVHIFKWAVGDELIPAWVHEALRCVEGLRRNTKGVRETAVVRPVADSQVEKIQPFVSRQVWALIQLLRLTGARAGEMVVMRAMDISEMNADVWIYTPGSDREFGEHKNAHRGLPKIIALGPRAQEIIRPFLKADPQAYLFSPAEAERERYEAARAKRRVPLRPCDLRRKRKRRPKRAPGDHYTTSSLGWAIRRACDRAGIKRWHVHQLRHAAATAIDATFGPDGSQAVLGHASERMTRRYIEMKARAVEVARRIG